MVGAIGNKRVVVLLGAVAAAALVVALAVVASKPAGAAADVMPDLRMAHAQNLYIENTADGRKLLRFDSIVVNVGTGPFELHGTDNTGASEMGTVTQRIFDDAGGYRDVPTAATMVYGGDGHNHWHVRNLQDWELIRLDNGKVHVGSGAKMGFCFYDTTNYGSSDPKVYVASANDPTKPWEVTSCDGGSSATQTMMGLSAGWGDNYRSTLPDQYIDITGLSSGKYKLKLIADLDNWFVESDNRNQISWINIRLNVTSDTVSIKRVGPGA